MIRTEALCVSFAQKTGLLRSARRMVLDHLDLVIREGEILGLMGSSGCGKTTLGRTILRLQKETSGKIFFRGEDITLCRPGHMGICKNRMQIVYQHSGQAMNPYMTVRSILMEAILAGSEPNLPPEALLEDVGLPKSELEKYPSELSGGQQQRVCIARAMAVRPDFVFLDEPLSALDTNTQARIITLLHRLRDRYHFTALFVSHDPGQIRALCDRTCRMQDGKIEEDLTDH